MEVFKKWLNKVFIDGLSGMATGLFATLLIGTIIQQIGNLIGGQVGKLRQRLPAQELAAV